MASLYKRICVAVEEMLVFSEQPGAINGIEDAVGRMFTVQAPALKLLEPGVPTEIRLQHVSKDEHGEFSSFGDCPVRRTVVRRDSGVIPLYYFV